MLIAFYVAAVLALVATARVVTSRHPVHALLYLVVSLLASAVIFYLLGAPFVAALEVVVYAGAIMVLFVFVMMLLDLGEEAAQRERLWLSPRVWLGPGVLAAALALETAWIAFAGAAGEGGAFVPAREVGLALYGPYLLAVEIASMLLLAGLVGAHHLGRRLVEGGAR